MVSYKRIGFCLLGLTFLFLFMGLLLIGVSKFEVDNGLPPGSNGTVYTSVNGYTVLSQYFTISEILHSSSIFFDPKSLTILQSGIIFAVILTPIAAVTTIGMIFSGYYWEK